MTLKFNAKIQFSSDKENSSIYHSINTDNEFYPENPTKQKSLLIKKYSLNLNLNIYPICGQI